MLIFIFSLLFERDKRIYLYIRHTRQVLYINVYLVLMSGTKVWPELVGRTFQEASMRILAFDNSQDKIRLEMLNFVLRCDVF